MKDIYELLNDIDIDEKEFEEAYASEKEKARVKLSLKKSIVKKKLSSKRKMAIAASIAFLVSTSIIAVNPALAKNIPIISSLLNKELVSVNKNYENYNNVIGKVRSDKGIDVTFESAIADDNKLFLNFIVKNNNKEIKEDYMDALLIPTSLRVNGNKVSTGAGASFEFIDNNTIRVLKKIDWSEDKKKNKMNIDIYIDELYGQKGNWGVSFFIDKSNLMNKTIEHHVNKNLEIDGEKGKIENVTVSPLTISIKGIEDFGETKNEGKMGEDRHFGDFIALDDKGEGLLWDELSLEDSAKSNVHKWTTHFVNTGNSKSVTIIPMYRTNKERNKLPSVKLYVSSPSKPLTLTRDGDRSIKIEDYFIEGDYLVVKYANEYKGKSIFKNYIETPVYLTCDGVKVEEVDRKIINELYNKYESNKHITSIYKIGKSRNIMIGTYDGADLMIMKDKSVTIKME